MTLTPEGQVIINGDLAITGKVLANKIQALQADLDNLTTQTATISALTTNQLIIATSANASESATATVSGELISNSIVNTATLPAGETEVVITNTNVTQDTYIYLTATSDTQNQVLFVKSKEEGSFTIGINLPQTQPIEFNYWLIQTLPSITNTAQWKQEIKRQTKSSWNNK